jgi:lactaldehyde reductase
MEYNAPATGEKYRDIAKAMGVSGVDAMSLDEAKKAAIDAVKQLSRDVGIPANLKEIVNPKDIDFLAQSAFDDACRPGNPRETSVEEIKELYLKLM